MAITVTVNSIDFTFNFDTQVIDVDNTVTALDVYDLWAAIRTAAGTEVGITYPPIARASGLDMLDSTSGIATFITVTLFDNWEVNSLRSSGKFTLTGGNLLREDGADPFLDNPLITYFAFFSQAGTVTTVSTGSGLSPEQAAQLASTAEKTDLLINDQGLNALAPKVITEVTEGESYTEEVNGVTKTIVKSGSTTTVTRTS